MKNILLTLILTSTILNAQNEKIIKEVFLIQSVNKIDSIAIENGFEGKKIIYIEAFFKSDFTGNITDITVKDREEVFESEILSIINQIPNLDPNEYLHKGREMKYGLKIIIKLPSNSDRKRRIKKGTTDYINFIGLHVVKYFPVKWIEIPENETENFSIVEKVPVPMSCIDAKNEIERRNCLSKSVQMHVNRKFNIDLVQELGISHGKKRIVVSFVISKTGEIVNIEATGCHESLEEEAIRVINTLSNFHKPGTTDGKPVNVKYSLPISFIVL